MIYWNIIEWLWKSPPTHGVLYCSHSSFIYNDHTCIKSHVPLLQSWMKSLISEIWMIFHVWNKISHSISWTIFISSWNFLKLDSWKYKLQSAHEIKNFWAVQFLKFFCSSETSPPKYQTAPHKFFLDCLGHPLPLFIPSDFFLSHFFDLMPLWTLRGALSFKHSNYFIFSHIESKLNSNFMFSYIHFY